jgi:S-disulfanyl-L-cysteine oxidoreductase SoxD
MFVAPIFALAAETPSTPDDPVGGWFTREQAVRGRAEYRVQCASCHADNLAGSGPAPPLAGSAFISKWSASTVFDLFERVRTTMPQNAPNSLGDAVYADIVAFVLRANNFPTGRSELPPGSEKLRKMSMSGGPF